MNRSLIILLGALTLGAMVFGGSYALSQRVCRLCDTPAAGSVDWLRQEYHLNPDQMARIQKLHEDYLIRCVAMCQMVADKKQAVKVAMEAALGSSTNLKADAGQLADLAACRADCKSQMLKYFVGVSQLMPPAAGRRYLAEMMADLTKSEFGSSDRAANSPQPMSTDPVHGTH